MAAEYFTILNAPLEYVITDKKIIKKCLMLTLFQKVVDVS